LAFEFAVSIALADCDRIRGRRLLVLHVEDLIHHGRRDIRVLFDVVGTQDFFRRAMACQARINPLKDIVYGMGEPTGDAHEFRRADR
jgi:hypothetical protein